MPKREEVLVYPSYGALHSPLSSALRDFMEPHIRATRFRDPALPLFAGFKPGMLTTAEELVEAFIRNYTDPVWLDHLRFGLRKLGVRLAIAPGPGKPLQMSVMQWPFEVVEVLTPPDIVRAMSTIHELALG
jgi:hypothetical protein